MKITTTKLSVLEYLWHGARFEEYVTLRTGASKRVIRNMAKDGLIVQNKIGAWAITTRGNLTLGQSRIKTA